MLLLKYLPAFATHRWRFHPFAAKLITSRLKSLAVAEPHIFVACAGPVGLVRLAESARSDPRALSFVMHVLLR